MSLLGTKDKREGLWKWARGQQHKLKNERGKLEDRIKAIDFDLERFAQIEYAAKPNPCKACDGLGKIRHWIAQDESEVKDCRTCRGSGEGPDVVTQLGKVVS